MNVSSSWLVHSLGDALVLVGFGLPWLIQAPTAALFAIPGATERLPVWQVGADWWILTVVVLLGLILGWLPKLWAAWASLVVAGVAMMLAVFWTEAQSLPGAVLFSSGFWLLMTGLALAIFAAATRIAKPRVASGGFLLVAVVLVGNLVWGGSAQDQLLARLQQEWQSGALPGRITEHLLMAGYGTLGAVVLGIALGIWGSFRARAGLIWNALAAIAFTIPSLALLGILLEAFSSLSQSFPALAAMGLSGLGPAPVVAALVIYGIFPVLRATLSGLSQLPAAELEAAQGMGMGKGQIFWQLRIPRAIPFIAGGVRTAAVMSVGIASLGQLVGAGGLGYYLLFGISQVSVVQIMVGVVPLLGLALLFDGGLAWLQTRLTPVALRALS